MTLKIGDTIPGALAATIDPLAFAQMDPERKRQKLEAQLLKTIELERRAATRVKRAVTLHQKYQRNRRRLESRIGAAEVQRIVARLTAK